MKDLLYLTVLHLTKIGLLVLTDLTILQERGWSLFSIDNIFFRLRCDNKSSKNNKGVLINFDARLTTLSIFCLFIVVTFPHQAIIQKVIIL